VTRAFYDRRYCAENISGILCFQFSGKRSGATSPARRCSAQASKKEVRSLQPLSVESVTIGIRCRLHAGVRARFDLRVASAAVGLSWRLTVHVFPAIPASHCAAPVLLYTPMVESNQLRSSCRDSAHTCRLYSRSRLYTSLPSACLWCVT